MRTLLKLLILSLLTCLSLPIFAEEPLDPSQAFRFSAQVVDAHTIEARWDIAPGYYLYRDKISFSVTPGALGNVALPAGQVKDDPNFGRVEIYRDSLQLLLPVNASGHITLNAISQGCADIGICYPPQKRAVTLDLPATGNAPAADAPVAAVAAPTWETRIARPQLYGPVILGLLGVLLAAVPMRVRRGLWFKGAGFILMFVAAMLLLGLNHEDTAPATPSSTSPNSAPPNQTH